MKEGARESTLFLVFGVILLLFMEHILLLFLEYILLLFYDDNFDDEQSKLSNASYHPNKRETFMP